MKQAASIVTTSGILALAALLGACAPLAGSEVPAQIESVDTQLGGFAGKENQFREVELGRAAYYGPRICASGPTSVGMDISAYNPGTNWTTAKKGGVGYAIIKATEGTGWVSGVFASDWANSQKAGVVRGAYHYFHPGMDPAAQAKLFLKTVGKLGAADLPAVLDWEVSDGYGAATQIRNAAIWLQTVHAATGKIPMVYTGPAFWAALGNPKDFASYPLFISNYQVTCPIVPSPWKTWTFWQQGSAPISGVVAKAVDYDVFNGTLSQLAAFAKKTN